MDIAKTLRELYLEKRRLDTAILALEARLKATDRPTKRRGRKSMSPAERLEVSKRMKLYWQARRDGSSQATNGNDPSTITA